MSVEPLPQRRIPFLQEGVLQQVFPSLSINDLACSSAVSRQWKATADKVKKTTIFPGVNAGFLYQLTDSRLNILQRHFGYKLDQIIFEEPDLNALREMQQRI